MDKNEYRIKTEQMLGYMKEKSYDKAMEIADTIEWRKVKNASVLCAVSEIYEYNGEYKKSREILLMAYERAGGSRKIVYRLATLALKANDTKEATEYYEEFVAMAPKDPNQYILRYKILRKQEAPAAQKIEALEDFKKAEYVEKWAYELAKLYHEAGMVTECLEECDDLILWFSEGKYVYQAMELKMKYKPLTPLQQEKYIHRNDPPKVEEAETTEEAKPEAAPEAVEEAEPVAAPEAVEEAEPEAVPEAVEEAEEAESETVPEAEETESETAPEESEEEAESETAPEESEEAESEAVEEQSSGITQTVTGATLAEALAAGVAVATHTATVGEVIDAAESVAEEKLQKELQEEKSEGPIPSIEEILLGWEEKQKENAQIIQAEQERVQSEKAERELEKQNADDEMDSILPDDIRQLMEELEAESSERKAQKEKAKSEEVITPSIKEEVIEDVAEEPAPVEEPVSEAEEGPVEEFFEEEFLEEEPEMDTFEEIEEIEDPEESEGIKLGDTQAIAISAKALMNDKEVEIHEEAPKRTAPTSPFDTGFIVQGRYDLDAQSEIGLKAGLTEEQKKLFSYFVPVRGMSEQIVDVLENDRKCKSRYGTSRTANILIVGRKGSGKTVLAVDIVKAIQKTRNLEQGKVGIVTAESLNKKDVSHIVEKLKGGALIIERAAKLNKKTIAELNELMEEQTEEMLVVLEEERRPLDKMLSAHPAFKKKFTSRLELPVFINDELVTFGQTYAKENGFKIDDMGILALYSRIDLMQREESVVTVADVKDIIDEAIEKAQKTNFKSFMKKLFKKNTDESARIILTEKDFK